MELEEDFLAPVVRYLRSSQVMQDLRLLIPEGGLNPVLGPPSYINTTSGLQSYSDTVYSMWIFRNFDPQGAPKRVVEGTGTCAITLTSPAPWSRMNSWNRLAFPEITVHYHCDSTRDEIGAPSTSDATDKCLTLHKAVLDLMHITDNSSSTGFMMWGPRSDGTHALKVISSCSGRGLAIYPVPSGDSMVEGIATFTLEAKL